MEASIRGTFVNIVLNWNIDEKCNSNKKKHLIEFERHRHEGGGFSVRPSKGSSVSGFKRLRFPIVEEDGVSAGHWHGLNAELSS